MSDDFPSMLVPRKPFATVDGAFLGRVLRAAKRHSRDPLDDILAARAKPHRRVKVAVGATVAVPPDIIEAAETLHRFFAESGITDWKLGNVQARRDCPVQRA